MTIYEKVKIARERLGLSQAEAALRADMKQKDVSLMENSGMKQVPEKYIRFLYKEGYDLNSLWDDRIELRSVGDDTPLSIAHVAEQDHGYSASTPLAKSTVKTIKPLKVDPPTDPPTKILLPQIITVDNNADENILHVSLKVAAGYVDGTSDPKYLERLPSFRLPGLNTGSYRSFEVDGDSMFPTLKSGEMVIGEWLEKLDYIREDRVHIIVLKQGRPLIKRLLNRIATRNVIIAKSDATNNRGLYKNIEINPEDVLEVWYARFHGGFDFQSPSDMWNRVNNHEADLTILQSQVERLAEVIKSAGLIKE